ncbi:GIY-YIG nuclease family protein [Patescibacteria group bacterium]
MAHVYILKSFRDDGFYIGSTRNLDNRIRRHFKGRSKSTKNRLPLELVYKKEFENYSEAAKFEYYIKRQKSRKFIESLIQGNK